MEEKEGERGSLHNCKIENENSKEKQVIRKATSMETDEALGRRCKGNEAEGKGQAQRACTCAFIGCMLCNPAIKPRSNRIHA